MSLYNLDNFRAILIKRCEELEIGLSKNANKILDDQNSINF